MSVSVKIPTQLRALTGGQSELVVEGAGDLRSLIDSLGQSHPEFVERIMGEDGEIRRFINVYVGDEDARFLQGMDTKLAENESISILPAVAGGGAAVVI